MTTETDRSIEYLETLIVLAKFKLLHDLIHLKNEVCCCRTGAPCPYCRVCPKTP